MRKPPVEALFKIIRALLNHRLLLAFGIALSTHCLAADTHEAFEQLLQIPQAQVGADADLANQDPTQQVDENAEAKFIQWLDTSVTLEPNRYEHQGTLLHHAVRADLKALTIWLLAHGADPTTPLPVYGDPNLDSLGIALKMQHWDIVDVLLDLPVYKKLTPNLLTERYMPYAPAALDQLIARRFAMPQNEHAACLLTVQLQNTAIQQALELPAEHEAAVGPESADPWCKRLTNQPAKVSAQAFNMIDWNAWNSLDSRIKGPVFKFLLATLKSPKDVQVLFASTLRKPNDAGLVDAIKPWVAPTDSPYKESADLLPIAVRMALSAHLRPEQIGQWMNDKKSLQSWLMFAAQGTGEEFDWALSKIPDSALMTYPEVAVESVRRASEMRSDAKALWPYLLKREALDLRKAGNPAILNDVPEDAWPDLFARGHQINSLQNQKYYRTEPVDEIGGWLMSDSSTLKRTWPLLAGQSPGFPAMIIDRYLGAFGRVLPQLCVDENSAITDVDLDRIETLLSLGATVHPKALLKSCVVNTKPEVYQRLLALGVILPTDNTPDNSWKKRFVINPLNCRFEPEAGWLKVLSAARLKSLVIQNLQLVDIPGTKACSLVVTSFGENNRGPMFDDFFKGQGAQGEGCAGGALQQLWSLKGNALIVSDLGDNNSDGIFPLLDTVDHTVFYWMPDNGWGRCTNLSPGYLLTFPAGKPNTLERVDVNAPVADAMRDQCGFFDDACLQQEATVNVREHARDVGTGLMYFDAFMQQYFSPQHTAYLAAISSFDVGKLSELQKNGVMPDWTLEAIDAVSSSLLTVPEKRRRIAWLFQDADQLSAALDCESCEHTNEIIIRLGSWLPREDWRPLIKALEANYDPKESPLRYEQLANMASDGNNYELACRFDKVIHAKCPPAEVAAGTP